LLVLETKLEICKFADNRCNMILIPNTKHGIDMRLVDLETDHIYQHMMTMMLMMMLMMMMMLMGLVGTQLLDSTT